MSDTAIHVENLGKRYQLGAAKSGSFRESLSRAFRRRVAAPPEAGDRRPEASSPVSSLRSPDSVFWALKDINFEIKRGEAVGIIGRNGAGKSTLLKILSRITEPTTGRYEIFGRVSSLLEVGTGFHPELTGRENVYLNGTILGMKRREVRAKFDEIVAFSGVEKFIDTPVKHYSSGMQVRLAFAVAAHLEPEILIIDEVLAVGDAEFQKKCLGKMEDVTGEGRTVLFVSHNMGAIRRLCTRSVILKGGKVLFDGAVNESVNIYLEESTQSLSKNGEISWLSDKMPGHEELRLCSVKVLDKDNKVKSSFSTEEPITIEITYLLLEAVSGMRINFRLLTQDESILFASSTQSFEEIKKVSGTYKCYMTLPSNLLNEGRYKVFIQAGCPNVKELLVGDIYLEFNVDRLDFAGVSDMRVLPGYISPSVSWYIDKVEHGKADSLEINSYS